MTTRTRSIILALTVVGATSAAIPVAVQAEGNGVGAPLTAGPAGGIVPLREPGMGAAKTVGARATNNLVYHNGPVMTTGAAVTSIFWGSGWNTASIAGDKITGLDTFYGGIGGSSYMNTNTEYTQTGGAKVSPAVSFNGHVIDTSAAPTTAPSTSQVFNIVARNITNPVANGYYPVYSDQPRGTAGYCAWHSYGTINGVTVKFAFFFRLDGDSGCNPGSSESYSQGLAALANVSGHELSEAVTDPLLNAWYDKQGAENSDKCAWNFGSTVSFGGLNWKIQRNWSNAAAGCIQTS